MSATSGTTYGVAGRSMSPDGTGVFGAHDATTGTEAGVRGETGSTDGSAAGVIGRVTSTSPGGYSAAVRGINEGTGGNGIGVWGSQSGSGWGVYGTSDSGVAVHASTGGTYGLFTPNQIWAGGGCTGCAISYIGINDDSQALDVGDVVAVSGIEPALDGQTWPVLKVRKAAGQAAIGVVRARGLPARQQEALTIEQAKGAAAPGEFLFIVVQGLAQVKADAASGSIAPGEWLGASETPGRAVKASSRDTAVGQALEALGQGTGLVWTLVGVR